MTPRTRNTSRWFKGVCWATDFRAVGGCQFGAIENGGIVKTATSMLSAFVCILAFLIFPDPADAQVSTQASAEWKQLPGRAQDISINSSGQAYAVGQDGTPWRWDAEEQRWRPMSGKFVRITASEGNRPWAIDSEGVVFRYNGLWWENKNTGVADVAADALGNVLIAKTDGSLHKWNPLRSDWSPLPGRARRLALNASGEPWIIGPDGRIRVRNEAGWRELPGRALDIAVGGEAGGVIVDMEKRVRTWSAKEERWVVKDGVSGVIAVAAAPDGGPWAVMSDGRIMAATLLVKPTRVKQEEGRAPKIQAPPIGASVDSASVPVPPTANAPPVTVSTANAPSSQAPSSSASSPKAPVETALPPRSRSAAGEGAGTSAGGPNILRPAAGAPVASDPETASARGPFIFEDTRKVASEIAIGADGSVYALDAGGNVLRWSNTRAAFDAFPGTLVRLAVDPEGNPWGISALGRVFRHTGKAWLQIAGATASDIAVGADGTVVTADAASKLFKLNSAQTRFNLLPGRTGAVVAVARDGTPWTIRSDRLLQRCDGSPCRTIAQKAVSVAAGPDGSIWVVSEQGRLLRKRPSDKEFVEVPVKGHTPVKVAVGPMGYPWVVTSANAVLASHFFDRDETGDRAVAASSSGATQGSGETAAVVSAEVSGFSFSKNMRFDTISNSLSGSAQIETGGDGSVWIYGTGTSFQVYNSSKRQFEDEKTTLVTNSYDMSDFDVASNGDIWAVTQSPTTSLIREQNNSLKEFSVSGYSPSAVSVAPDDSVYVIFVSGSSNVLYKKAANASTFTKFSNDTDVHDISVGPGNDVWIVDKSNYVQQWTGKKFENRPASGQKASRVSVGGDGTVYIVDTSKAARKWNGANKSFDKVNNTAIDYVAVDADGRLWTSEGSDEPTIKRARD
jgi:hypothetical protein